MRTAAEWVPLRPAVPALGVGLAGLAVLFHTEAAAAFSVWLASTAYNHCFLILPIALYLAWERRATIAKLAPRPTGWALALALPLALFWLLANTLGVMEGRQLAAMGFVQLLFLGVLGWTLYRRMIVPLLYLFFLVPFGSFLTPALQGFTTHFVVAGLDLLGIPNFSDRYVIEIPEGAFRIAEACAGLRFLIAAIAFGVLYACLIYRRPWKRLIYIAASLVVPVIANGLRALGIVWLGHELGSAKAAAVDHVVYGYIFFSIVILLLIIIGMPFADKALPAPTKRPAPHAASAGAPPALLLAIALGLATLAALGPLASAALASIAATHPLAPHFTLRSCTPTSAEGSKGRSIAHAGGRLLRLSCPDHGVTFEIAVFPPRANPRPIIDAMQRLSGRNAKEAVQQSLVTPRGKPRRWSFIFSTPPFRATASSLWIDGEPASGNMQSRLRQVLNSFSPHPLAPLVVVISPNALDSADAQQRIRSFLAAHPDLSTRLTHLAGSS